MTLGRNFTTKSFKFNTETYEAVNINRFNLERQESLKLITCRWSLKEDRGIILCLAFNYFSLVFPLMWRRNSAVLKRGNRDLQVRLRLRVRVRVFQCVPGAHARLREAVTSTRSVVKISSPSWRELRDFQQISSPDYEFTTDAKAS